MTSVTKKDVLGYMFSPQLRGRFRDLFASGFQHIPYLIALVYQTVRLLPNNHPYLNMQNVGKFGIRHVIAEAANNLVISKNNIDQIILFFVVLMGLVLIVIQIGMLGFAAIAQPAMAAMPTNFSGFFITPNPEQDIAMIMLDMVFGVEDMFNSCIATAAECVDTRNEGIVNGATGARLLNELGWPFPIHHATHQLFQIYNIGLLVVAAFITMYFITTVIAETAQTGTPFGKRFNKVWAPIRIVVAIGLLVPLSQGLNSSQFIVLYAAKYGSGFATNGWNLFNASLGFDAQAGRTLAGGDTNTRLVATPNVPEIGGLLQMLYTAKICRELHQLRDGVEIDPYLVKNVRDGAVGGSLPLRGTYGAEGGFTTYEEMIAFADGTAQVVIRFGPAPDENSFGKDMGYVGPLCGEIILPLTDARAPGSVNPPDRGAEIMQRTYWWMVHILWYYIYDGDQVLGNDFNYPLTTARYYTSFWTGNRNALILPPTDLVPIRLQYTKDWLRAALEDPASQAMLAGVPGLGAGAVIEQQNDPRWDFGVVLRSKGWGGAAIWYNKIAELNGSLSAAVFNAPIISRYPKVMEYVLAKQKAASQTLTAKDRFNPNIDIDKKAITFETADDKQFADALWAGFDYWQSKGHGASSQTVVTDNAFIDAINQFFGTDGLFSMRSNPDIHPLAQLVSVGRSLIQSALRNLGLSAGAALAGAGLSFMDKGLGEGMSVAIGFFMTVSTIGMTIGFILFYIVPFLPFIYFFFALGGWIKGIFEAMVGAPLWALAHIRIDGNGLPGQAAVNGYFLIFEIFLRPILIIFGMLASISIFSALVSVLNDVWDLVTANLAGFDVAADNAAPATQKLTEFLRGPVDKFFFTLVYAIVVYMMAMSSFKLIDLIPNNILRWIGQSVSTFNDQREDAAQSLVGTASVGGQQAFQSVGEGAKGALQGVATSGASKGAGGG